MALTPDGVREFERQGIGVYVETGAGEGAASLATLITSPPAPPSCRPPPMPGAQEMVVKVKEPKQEEFGDPARPDAVHLIRTLPPTRLWQRRSPPPAPRRWPTRLAQLPGGALPKLSSPMSEVAGRLAPQMGAHYLERHNGGRGC